jgi:hypothetical protein
MATRGTYCVDQVSERASRGPCRQGLIACRSTVRPGIRSRTVSRAAQFILAACNTMGCYATSFRILTGVGDFERCLPDRRTACGSTACRMSC